MNADLKIICKALARRFEKIKPNIMNPDQTGFIKGRHSTNNTQRLINLIDYYNRQNRDAIIASSDAEKAFDRVNWNFFLHHIRKNVGLGIIL